MLEFGAIHQKFLADDTPQIDLEGARYSAKTWTCCAKVLTSAKEHSGIRWLACRYSNEEAKTKIKTVLQYEVAPRMGIDLHWTEDEKAFTVPTVAGDSKVFVHGLKAQSRQEELAKVRGLDMGGIWNDQSEELPQAVAEELPFGTRQQGYPHQLILSPNPPAEDHFITDMFPDECLYNIPRDQRIFPHRAYYRLSLYDNPHCPKDKLSELEAAFPPTHAKYKSLIMGLRGPNVTGTPVYDGAFLAALHVSGVTDDPTKQLLEAFHSGQHHPVWLVAQRSHHGALHILGGVIGKRLFLEDFIPIVQDKRLEWFGPHRDFRSCCDDPRDSVTATKLVDAEAVKQAKIKLQWSKLSSAPDVRESVIQTLGSMMLRRTTQGQAFQVSNDPSRFLMASRSVVKQTKMFIDALEGSYVWDQNYVSVGNRTVRQPKFDEWVTGQQRCLENMTLNFCVSRPSDADKDAKELQKRLREREGGLSGPSGPNSWMGF